MGSISLRKDGRYMGRVYINHRQVCVYGKSKSEVNEKLKNLVNKNKVETNYFKMSLFDFAMQYLENFKKPVMKETSYRQRVYQVERWKNNKLFTKKLVNIKHFDLAKFFAEDDTKYISYLILKEIFDKAKEIGIIQYNPMALIQKPKIDTIEDRVELITNENVIYTQEQIQKLKESSDKDMWLIFKTLLCTGLRIGELLALQKNDFDIEHKTLRVYKSLDSYGKIQTTKTKKGTRLTPLFDTLIDEIKPYLDTLNDDEIVFKINYATLGARAKVLGKKLGFTIGLHKFRKTFISICQFKLGISTQVVAQWVGHANTSTTQDFYSFLTSEENEKIASMSKLEFN